MKFTMRLTQANNGGSAPATPGFNAVAPEWFFQGAAGAAPAIPAAESTLGSHPCVALSSAQVLPEWINRNPAVHGFSANGDNPLNFVSHSRGSLQVGRGSLLQPSELGRKRGSMQVTRQERGQRFVRLHALRCDSETGSALGRTSWRGNRDLTCRRTCRHGHRHLRVRIYRELRRLHASKGDFCCL